MKIYTKKGDSGTTSLAGGSRVAKDDPRVEAYGTVDELCACTGHLYDLMTAGGAPETLCEDLLHVMRELMNVSALLASDLSSPGGREAAGKCSIRPSAIAGLETSIDRMDAALPELCHFTLPCGHPLVSYAHVCRTVCRRAERACVSSSRTCRADDAAMVYLNRLSDYFYLLARTLAHHYSAVETCWLPGE